MDEQRWLEVRRIFEAAVEHPDDRRGAFLDEVCGSDVALREQISGLLQGDLAGHRLLETGAAASDLSREQDPPDPEPPRTVGAYRILDEVGRGGMGVVYRAERADGAFDRVMALKLVRGGFDSEEITARFHAERRILANLQHPNVARLYDAGLAKDGRPYLVMELVVGDPVDRYCDARKLDVPGRIRLLRSVCNAVEYAHRNLVIHRDLKPSNILVDAEGSVRLLDFGVAKLMAPESAEAPRTRTGRRLLTPEYAAPEQIRGDPLTTGCDVYSLGVVLYELLTGRRPFDEWGSLAHALGSDDTPGPAMPSRVVTQPVEVPRADGTTETLLPVELGRRRRTTSDGLRRTLRGDLDRILLTALARDPAERYSSVAALADDLDRHLRGLPVSAQPPSLAYQARKFVQRHKAGVTAAALVTLTVGAAGAVAARESRIADEEREVALGVSAFLEDLFQASDPREMQVQDSTRMIDFLDASAGRIEQELADQPRTRARMLLVLGRTFNNIGRTDRAEPLLREAIEASRALSGTVSEDVAEAQRVLGLLLSAQDRFEEAVSMLRDALDSQRSLTGEESWQVGRLHEALGQALMSARRPDEAAPHIEASLEIRRAVLEPDDPVISSSLNTLAALRSRMGDDEAAARLFGEAIEASFRSPATVPEDIGVQRMNLANVYMRLGRHEEALAQSRQAHEILQNNPRPWVVARSRARLAEALANVWADTGEDKLAMEADSLFRSGIELMRTLPEGGVRFMLHAHAGFLERRGDLPGAEAAMREAIERSAAVVGANHPETWGLRANLAGILLAAGRTEEADPLSRTSHEVLADAWPIGHPTRTFVVTGRARVLTALGRFAEAVELLESEHEETASVLGDAHPLVVAQREALVTARARAGPRQ